MMRINCKTKVTKFNTVRPLTAFGPLYTIGDPKIGFDFREPTDSPYAFYNVIVNYDSNDEAGGSVEFEAQTVCAIDNKKQMPDIDLLIGATEYAMAEINKVFHKHYATMNGLGFTKDIISYKPGIFTEASLRAELKKLLDNHYRKEQ